MQEWEAIRNKLLEGFEVFAVAWSKIKSAVQPLLEMIQRAQEVGIMIPQEKEWLKSAIQKRERFLQYTKHSKKREKHERLIKMYRARLEELEKAENTLKELLG